MITLKTHFSKKEITYRGPELSPHFVLSQFKIEGSALVCWKGPAQVKTEDLVDWEDRLASDSIRAAQMLHFLGEFFGLTLREGVWLQRTLVSIVLDELKKHASKHAKNWIREGDDLFFVQGSKRSKLSVSIVTVSGVSVLLHLALNIDPEGAPVRAIGLKDFFKPTEVNELAKSILSRFEVEWNSVERATVKVKPVKVKPAKVKPVKARPV